MFAQSVHRFQTLALTVQSKGHNNELSFHGSHSEMVDMGEILT